MDGFGLQRRIDFGAAGILKGLPATTHGYKMGVLRIMGAKPDPDQRIVPSGKIITAAGGLRRSNWLSNTTYIHRSTAGT